MSPLWILLGLLVGVILLRGRVRSLWLRDNPPPKPPFEPALSWSIEPDDERHDGQRAHGEEFLHFRSILRTTDLSRLMIFQTQLDQAGIRYYRSQHNVLHGGDVQLFVEADRLAEAESILNQVDTPLS